MAVSKKQVLRKMLSPYGFKMKSNTLYRVCRDECVHVIKNCLLAPGEALVQTTVYSIFDAELASYFSSSPVLPYSYNCISFDGKSPKDRVYLNEKEYLSGEHKIIFFTKEMQPYVFYQPSFEEELDIIMNWVLNKLDIVDSQKRIIEFYNEWDMFEYGRWQLSNTPRMYAALAMGDLEQCKDSYEALFSHHQSAMESYRMRYSPEESASLCQRVIDEESDLRRIQQMVEHRKSNEIRNFLNSIKTRNLDFLK